MTKYFMILVSVLMVSGCSNKMKQKVGLLTPGPNEYAVEKQRPLEIPPHYDLPVPGSLSKE